MLFFSALLALAASLSVAEAISSLGELPFNADERLSSHVLLFHGDEHCATHFAEADFALRTVLSIDSEDLAQSFFPHESEQEYSCAAVCLERGTHLSHVLSPLDFHRIVDSEDFHADISSRCQTAEIGFLSYLSADAQVYWLDEESERHLIGPLKPGERNTFWIQSFLGHRFQVVDAQGVVAKEFTVEYNAIMPVGQYTSHVREREVSAEVRRTFDTEWTRAHRVQRTFTEFGFSKGRLPTDIFSSMSSFYYNNRDHATIEEWGGKGVFVNWWEKDVFFVAMPYKLKKHWQARLKDLVEKWVGVPIELTDIYGMRKYEDGARLLTHVDREATHATSLIINVAQGGIREPWKIEIYDFADRLHEVEMSEGDIVYYESARCLHGRMQPLQGAYYVNLFAHYRPIGDPEWFLKPNPPGTIPQVLDLGQCSSNGTNVTCEKHETPYLSPKLQTLRSGADLYRFWQETSPTKAPSALDTSRSEL